jgi:regulator of CtrA degradation
MSREQVASEKAKVRLDTASAHENAPGWPELPAAFKEIVLRSLRLQAVVRRMDEEIYGGEEAVDAGRRGAGNPVSDQITLLNTVFARG